MIITTAIDQVHAALGSHESPSRVWLVGAPWFDTPATILEGLAKASTESSFPYPPPQGIGELREAVCALHLQEGVALSPEQVVVTHGAKAGITAALGCLLDPGTELLHPTPSYPAYSAIARALGATPIPLPQEGGRYSLTTALLEEQLTSKSRAVILSSPCNPTGAVLNKEQAEITVDFCRRHKLRLICDEAYAAFSPIGRSGRGIADLDPALETVVMIRSFSKVFAVCGWRIGYIAADAELTGRVVRWQSALLNPPNCIAQKALVTAPEVSREILVRNRERVRSRLEDLAAALTGAGLPAQPPEGGFYLWVDLRPALVALGLTSSLSFCRNLARDQGIGLWPGEDYHCPGFGRISAVGCTDADWKGAVSRLAAGIRSFLANSEV